MRRAPIVLPGKTPPRCAHLKGLGRDKATGAASSYHTDSGMVINRSGPTSQNERYLILLSCACGVAALGFAERYLGPTIPLGGFFFIPLFVAAAFLSRGSIFLCSIAVAIFRESVGPFAWGEDAVARVALSMVAYTGGALIAGELVRNRRMATELLHRTQEEGRTRLDAAQEVRALVENSPAAVLTIDSGGKIAMANEAARRLLGFKTDSPEGELVENYIPLLSKLLKSTQVTSLMRTMVEAKGRRRNAEVFHSQAWVSAYNSASGPRLAAILLDTTEQLRDREESGLRQLLSNSKIIAGAVSHELRNLAAAAAVLHHNTSADPAVRDNPDFEALGRVIESVQRLSAAELEETSEDVLEGLDISALLQELRMIITRIFEDSPTAIEWEIADLLPPVRASRSGLLQVFLNLSQNTVQSLEAQADGRLKIIAYTLPDSVVIRFSDNGPGISSAERLFQPFQAGASSSGLGLFVSRAIIRTFGGDLHHTQRPGECSFIIE